MATSATVELSSLPSPTSLLFARGVIAKLAVWHALRIAVDQGWGGPESATKRTWLASVIVDAFEQEDPQPDVSYVELTLLQVMEDEFDTVLEDGSAEVVAKDIVRLWSDIQSGNENGVQEFERQADGLKGKKVQAEEGADGSDWEDESGDESGDSESDAVPALIEVESKSEKLAPEVDEDGFTMVKGKGSRHK